MIGGAVKRRMETSPPPCSRHHAAGSPAKGTYPKKETGQVGLRSAESTVTRIGLMMSLQGKWTLTSFLVEYIPITYKITIVKFRNSSRDLGICFLHQTSPKSGSDMCLVNYSS